jgi:cytochrome c556
MKTRATILKSLGASALLAALTACGGGASGPSFDPESPEGSAYLYRESVMELARQKSALLLGMAREEMPLDEAAFVKAAADLAALSDMMIEGFATEALVEESRTDPAVWENRDDFESKIDALVAATAELAETAQSGGFAAAQGMVQPATSQNCGSCHRAYRLPEPE